MFFPWLMSLEFLAYLLGSNFTNLSMKPPQVIISNIQHTMYYIVAVRLLPYSCPSFILFGKVGGPQLIDFNTYHEGCNGHVQASNSTIMVGGSKLHHDIIVVIVTHLYAMSCILLVSISN